MKANSSVLLLTQAIGKLKTPAIEYLLAESFKRTKTNLFVCYHFYNNNNDNKCDTSDHLNNNNNSNATVKTDLKASTNIRVQLRSLIRSLYRCSMRLDPSVNVSCVLPHLLKRQYEDARCFSYDMLLTDLRTADARNDQSVAERLVDQQFPHLQRSTASSEIAHDPFFVIDCSRFQEDSDHQTESQSTLQSNDMDLIALDRLYANSILGGTFDHLHVGHKLMLTESAMLTRDSLLIGVSDGLMLARKTLAELIEPIEVRCTAVERFVHAIAPELSVRTVPIYDMYGPTRTERDYECLIVSEETVKGGRMVNEERARHSLPPMDVHVVELMNEEDLETADEDDERKVSSSNMRKRLLGTLLREPRQRAAEDAKWPYVVGLTGGLASGKSTIRGDLTILGATTIDCDALGHRAYDKANSDGCYQQVVDAFGNEILDQEGNIDRQLLGKRVFEMGAGLARLNEIVWPSIKRLLFAEIAKCGEAGVRVVVIEAALLIEAGWHKIVDEVWVCIVPAEEVQIRKYGFFLVLFTFSLLIFLFCKKGGSTLRGAQQGERREGSTYSGSTIDKCRACALCKCCAELTVGARENCQTSN